MNAHSSATELMARPLPVPRNGIAWGFAGVVAFSLTVPMTRLAVESGHMSALFVGSARGVVAASIAAIALMITRSLRPRGRQWVSVGIVAMGAVLGFPLLTSLALTQTQASHGAVVIALLPATTAVVSVLRTGERPTAMFWVAAGAGAVAAVTFAAVHAGGLGQMGPADGLLFAAVIVCAIAYAEGGVLSRELGAWQTISWALVVAAPVMAVLTVVAVVSHAPTGTPVEWLGFVYLCVVSMFLGFVAWYRGLAIGPLAQVSQVQLAQPVMSIGWAALLLHEHLTAPTLIGGAVVIACALVAVRTRRRVRQSARVNSRLPAHVRLRRGRPARRRRPGS
ncbi:DMT family transporter [Microbacterium sp. zg.Y1090]|uniref:DMT family transporter n=1 Tax=Microbacterium TaxID=33882 RepID=UPI00214C5E0B|nr:MULTISPECIES: DMT family transporter [unclassified Microbacterium]MCR2812836.1 DMT family transporter [Microbacterium sp. zg.Y1084]MCR2817361.1 DMT family transporter [Microbacterium sp. zg.Y1090]WIM29152.1 DMT family transporter [Microbacterium sp. zg-Y1090]